MIPYGQLHILARSNQILYLVHLPFLVCLSYRSLYNPSELYTCKISIKHAAWYEKSKVKDAFVNRKVMYPVVVACLLAAVGCSPIPKATTVDQSPQVKLQSAQHWGVIAEHLSGQIMANANLASQPVYIDLEQSHSTFSKVFTQQLSSALVKRGATVMTSSATSLSMELDAQVVRHSNDRDKGTNFATTGTAGFQWALAELGDDLSVAEGISYGVIPLSVAYDVSKIFPSKTNTEVVITARIVDDYQIQFSETNSYYIPDMAMRQYKKSAVVNLTKNDGQGVEK